MRQELATQAGAPSESLCLSQQSIGWNATLLHEQTGQDLLKQNSDCASFSLQHSELLQTTVKTLEDTEVKGMMYHALQL